MPTEPINPSDLDVLMNRIREELRMSAPTLSQTSNALPHEQFNKTLDARKDNHYQFAEFSSLSNDVFARAAHLAALGREPNEIEKFTTLQRLETRQTGRASYLLELLNSPEGRRHGSTISGLRLQRILDQIRCNRLMRLVPIVLRLVRNAPRIANHVRQLAAQAATAERLALQAVTTAESAQRLAKLATESQKPLEARFQDLALKVSEHWRATEEQKLLLRKLQTELFKPEIQNIDAFYVSLEDRFRGLPADIKNRQSIYLQDIEQARSATGDAPVVDIGSGRGEWLELLKEKNIDAKGYDSNRIMVHECVQRGLEATLGAAPQIITTLPERSLSAVTAFHVIEHLPFDDLVRLFDESLRVLRPGGIIIFETPNPGNLLVAAERFYFDPTHRHPLPAELSVFVAEARGFTAVECRFLHAPSGYNEHHITEPALSELCARISAPQDYAIVGRKP